MYRALPFIFLIFTPAAAADVVLCNGRWTNRPCEDPQKVLEEAPPAPPSSSNPGTPEVSAKRSLLHDIRMKALNARRKYDLRFELGSLEHFCLETPSTKEQCAEKIAEVESKLDEKIVTAASLKQEEEKLRLQQEANRLQEERNRIEAERSTVTVVQPRVISPYYTTTTLYPHGSSSISIHGSGGGLDVSIEQRESTGGVVIPDHDHQHHKGKRRRHRTEDDKHRLVLPETTDPGAKNRGYTHPQPLPPLPR